MDKAYYSKMLAKGRMIPFIEGDKLIGMLTFYITNNVDKYIDRYDPWKVLSDEPETGKKCYVDQVWTNRQAHKYSFKIWKKFREFIKSEYPSVREIRWNRWNHKSNKLTQWEKCLI